MKIGVALSGGGIRGLAHAGVLKALEENGIKIDIIGGTSAGSMVASLYSIGYTPDEIYKCFINNYSKIVGGRSFPFFFGVKNLINKGTGINGLKKGENIENVFQQLAIGKNIDTISNIKMPIVIPTVDIKEAKEYIFTNNIPIGKEDNKKYISEISIGKAVRASSSFPAVFNTCNIEKHAFIDGGALDNIPVEEVKKQGADKVIAVKFEEDKVDENSSMMDIVMRTIDIMGNKIAEKNLEKSDYVIKINTGRMGLLETKNMEKCFRFGYETVNENIEKIEEAIGKNKFT